MKTATSRPRWARIGSELPEAASAVLRLVGVEAAIRLRKPVVGPAHRDGQETSMGRPRRLDGTRDLLKPHQFDPLPNLRALSCPVASGRRDGTLPRRPRASGGRRPVRGTTALRGRLRDGWDGVGGMAFGGGEVKVTNPSDRGAEGRAIPGPDHLRARPRTSLFPFHHEAEYALPPTGPSACHVERWISPRETGGPCRVGGFGSVLKD